MRRSHIEEPPTVLYFLVELLDFFLSGILQVEDVFLELLLCLFLKIVIEMLDESCLEANIMQPLRF